MNHKINKTMDRSDLLTQDAESMIYDINRLLIKLYSKCLFPSSWTGSIPKLNDKLLKMIFARFGKIYQSKCQDLDQRLEYKPLRITGDDARYPWFLFWEIYHVLKNIRKYLKPDMKILDAGGASSLFSCYMANLGYEVHTIDLDSVLVGNSNKIAKKMNWNMHSTTMNLQKLDFPDRYFDYAFSICVFEHLDYPIKVKALAEMARCLKTDGILSITFDYRNPAPGVFGYGKDTRARNRIKSKSDIRRSFFSEKSFQLIGNKEFYDNGKSYLVHKRFNNTPYTFGSVFLKKRNILK